MVVLSDIIKELQKEGKLRKDATQYDLTEEEWHIVEEAVSAKQSRQYDEGGRVGMREGMRPEEQAKNDRENPALEDPFRPKKIEGNSSGENKG